MTKKKADTQADHKTYVADNSKKIVIAKGQKSKVAAQLLARPTFVADIAGDLGGNNPYQHIRYLRRIGVAIAMYWDIDAGSNRYHITDAQSRALVSDALFRIGGNRG